MRLVWVAAVLTVAAAAGLGQSIPLETHVSSPRKVLGTLLPGANMPADAKAVLVTTWSDATLEKWLSDPDMVVKDDNMSFSVPKAEERRDLIALLKQ